MKDKTVAVLGAGGAGCCTALELADRGYQVLLFERRQQAVAEASYTNEGKIHLGLIYALDDSLRTAEKMIEGALTFDAYLKRWIPFKVEDALSTPFYYGVHQGSLQNPEQLLNYYQRCADYYSARAEATGLDYLGLDVGIQFRSLAESERPGGLDPEYIPTVIATSEYSVDPRVIATLLRDAIDHHPAISFHPGHEITGIEEISNGNLRLSMIHDGTPSSMDVPEVVNTCWYRRLAMDRPLGIVPAGNWSHRYKFANRIRVPLQADTIPSVTGVLGPFGDLVNFGDRGLYLSWYPTSRTGMSTEETPPDWDNQYSNTERMEIFQRSLEEWALRCTDLDKLDFTATDVDPDGGVIYALGTTDVDDGSSRLHDRFDIGMQSKGRYHTVDTGKFTLIPYWAVAIADRVEGKR